MPFQDLLTSQYLPGMAHEEQQEVVFLESHFYQVSCPSDFSCGLIEFQVSIGERFASGLMPTQHCPNPCYEFIEDEGFGNVIVGSQVEITHLIRDFITGGEHDDRDIVLEPQTTADLEAISSWHGDVQQDEMWLMLVDGSQPRLAIHSCIHLKAFVGEAPLE
jgi:hypothetical protein